jgi:hypothetical protein
MNKKIQLTEAVLDVVKALSELHLMLDKDEFMLGLFHKGIQTTGALPCSLDEFICEWQTLANNIEMDAVALYESWAKSAKLFKDVPEHKAKEVHLKDMGIKDYDIVFEDGSFIYTIFTLVGNKPNIMFDVTIGRDSHVFGDLELAKKCLWENHAKVSYGL